MWVRTFGVDLRPPKRITLFVDKPAVLPTPRVPRFGCCRLSLEVVSIASADSMCLALKESDAALGDTAIVVESWI